jgi:hypothetical protein
MANFCDSCKIISAITQKMGAFSRSCEPLRLYIQGGGILQRHQLMKNTVGKPLIESLPLCKNKRQGFKIEKHKIPITC